MAQLASSQTGRLKPGEGLVRFQPPEEAASSAFLDHRSKAPLRPLYDACISVLIIAQFGFALALGPGVD
jgi:hypothetical protein